MNGILVTATIALGLSAGALLAEAGVLVPIWKGMPADEFLAWYPKHAARLVGFYGPLEIAAVVLSALASLASWFHPATSVGVIALAFVLALGVLVAFPLYFQKANASFASGVIPLAELPGELRRWARWHGARTALAIGAFACSALALRA